MVRVKQVRWYQWLFTALILLYIVYVALSYLYLPGKLKQVAETDIAGRIGRNISAERISFNPFTLSLTIEGFLVSDQPGKPLVGWQRLFVNFSLLKSLFKWEIALDEFSIDRPEINIEKNGDRFNFSDIIDRLDTETAPEPAEKKSGRLALEIADSAIHQGVFRYADLSGATPARSDLNDVTLQVTDLYLATGDEKLNPFDLTAKIPGGGNVRLSGEYRIDPLHVDARITADAVQLATFSGFVENALPVKIGNGLLSLDTRLLLEKKNGIQMQLDQGRLEVSDLALDDDVSDPPMLRGQSIKVDGLSLDLQQRSVSVQNVALDGIRTHQWRDAAGKFRYEHLLAVHDSKEMPGAAPGKDTTAPWNIRIKQISLKNGTLDFSDQNEAITRDHALSDITADLENFSLTPETPISVQLSTLLDEKGKIQADGTLVLSPFSMNLNYKIDDLQLPPFAEYLETSTYLKIENGGLSITGSASMNNPAGSTLKAGLNLSVDGLQIQDTRTGSPLFNLGTFALKDLNLDAAARTIAVVSVDLEKPEVFAAISPEKTMNLATLFKPRGAASPQVKSGVKSSRETQSPPWKVSILKIRSQNGTAHFSDSSVTPTFTTGLEDIVLNADRITAKGPEPIPFSLTGKIDKYAPLAVKGTLSPLDRQPGFALTSTLEGFEMPTLSPYSAALIGNDLDSGRLSLNLDYRLQDRKLKGKNNIVAKNLYLGEKAPGKPAVNAPVALGLALLRNLDGVIDLDVGVAGDLDDPGFSVSGIIAKALVNVIVKAAASPFKLLGALVGGGENLGEIEFAQGLGSLTSDGEARLKKLSEALAKRPQLALQIQGNASESEDGPALKALQVLKQAAAARNISPAEFQAAAGNTDWWKVSENRDILETLNNALGLPGVPDRTRQVQTEKPSLQGDPLTEEVYRRLYSDVVAAQTIDTEMLLSLADSRALSIKQYLVDVLGLDHKRVSVTKARETDLTGRTLTLGIDAM